MQSHTSPSAIPPHVDTIARELSLVPRQIAGALALFAEGNTLPFIARYRKEATGGLDEVQLRAVHERATYLAELDDRRGVVLKSIDEQGKLTPELRAAIERVETKQALEDLYLPYKPKRRTRAMVARERGLEPLAELLAGGAHTDEALEQEAQRFVTANTGNANTGNANTEVTTVQEALAGARDIVAERIAEDAERRGRVRDLTRRRGIVRSRVTTAKAGDVTKFQDYYDFGQKLTEIPSHRMLAIRRGETEGVLLWSVEAPAEEILCGMEQELLDGHKAPGQMRLVIQDAYRRLLAPAVEVDLRLELKVRADEEAIAIFGQNLEQLLLSPPAGERIVIGLDPGFRTGVKVAAVSRTGAVLATDTVYLHHPDRFAATLLALVERYDVELIAIGNGTASRETETLVRELLQKLLQERQSGRPRGPEVVVVNEAGASVYSASDLAREELPELDVSLRGAVAIARRLQDPLAELVKIDPKAIGVGQYQHDVHQGRLKQRLDETVTSCVNRVGVEVNTASVSLLSYVAGVGPVLAQHIVRLRDERGGLRSRRDLLEVPRLGAKAFEQAAGFLRVRGGAHPLDASGVHPERYVLVERMATDLGVALSELIGNETLVGRIAVQEYVSEEVGIPTLQDILAELRKPARDPRQAFEPPRFREDIREPKDLKDGMILEGVVTNIVAFGAFVDIGVHQDGLVHVSQLADRYVSDPNQVVRVGQHVTVRVVSIDLVRNRIALSMRSETGREAGRGQSKETRAKETRATPRPARAPSSRVPKGASPEAPRILKAGEYAPNGMRFR